VKTVQNTLVRENFAPAIVALRESLAEIEEKVVTGYTLADAMREGSTVSEQEYNWGSGERACALSAATIAATARGYA
jgi:hypothetical protein